MRIVCQRGCQQSMPARFRFIQDSRASAQQRVALVQAHHLEPEEQAAQQACTAARACEAGESGGEAGEGGSALGAGWAMRAPFTSSCAAAWRHSLRRRPPKRPQG